MSGSESQTECFGDDGHGGTAPPRPVPVPAPPQPPKRPLQLNFKNHCFLCLQPQPFQSLLELARRNPKRIKSFQPILNYLTGTDPTHDRGKEECQRRGIPVMGTLPPVCLSCYDILAEVNRLHEQLLNVQWLIQKQVEVARKVVGGAFVPVHQSSLEGEGSEEVPQQFPFRSSIMSGGLSGEEVAAVLKVVDKLHRLVAGAGSTKAMFPTSMPPEFIPDPSYASSQSFFQQSSHQPAVVAVPIPIAVYHTTNQPSSEMDTSVVTSIPGSPAPGVTQSGRSRFRRSGVVVQPIQEVKNEAVEEVDIYSSTGSEAGEGEIDNEEGEDIDMGHPPIKTEEMTTELPSASSSTQGPPPPKKTKLVKKEGIRRRRPKGHPDIVRSPKTIRTYVNGISTAQQCDLCGKLIPFTEMPKHLQSHVKNYIVRCPRYGCPYLFSCTGKLKMHLNKTSAKCRKSATVSPDPYMRTCETCGFEAENGNKFHAHLRKHEKAIQEKRFGCPIPRCSERYGLRQSVDVHLYTHDLRAQISEQECSICKQMMQIEDLPQHFRDAHQVENYVSCKRCPLIFHDWVPLLDHFYEHRGRGGTTCDLCNDGITLFKYTYLRQHIYQVHQIGEMFPCKHCNKEFYSQSSLEIHIKSMHSKPVDTNQEKSPNSTNLSCESCPDVVFNHPDRLRSHHIKFHGADPLACIFCSKIFMKIRTVRRHEFQHVGLAMQTYPCEMESCGKTFSTKSALENHVNRIHLGRLPPRRICDTCGESFSCGATLKIHKLIHTGERSHLCPICGQAFRTKCVLQRHVKGHEEKGDDFKPNGEMKQVRKRVARNE